MAPILGHTPLAGILVTGPTLAIKRDWQRQLINGSFLKYCIIIGI